MSILIKKSSILLKISISPEIYPVPFGREGWGNINAKMTTNSFTQLH
jgi:hypothetical protein